MKTISWKDLTIIPELSHLTQWDFMNPQFDYLVNPYLYTLGFELGLGLEYRVCQHRTLSGEAIVGLQIVGEIRTDRAFLASPWATAEDRMVACGRTDRSLGDDLSKAMNVQVSYGNVFALDSEEQKELWMTQEEIEAIEDQIELMGNILKDVRGDMRRRDGSLKRPKDYFESEPYEKVRRKKKDRSTLRHREVV